jgi:biotin transport system substrate-specific component
MTLVPSTTAPFGAVRTRAAGLLAVVAGAVTVSLASQIAVPLPGTPVPMTLQPLAVLLVGGLLGARLGASSLALYLVLGAAGLPVFTPLGVPGLARLFGPTGGYLLAYPFAAAVVGWLTARRPGWGGVVAGPLLGMVAIHAGGVAQLLVLTGDAHAALAVGLAPFVVGDGLMIVAAALVLRRTIHLRRALG